MKKIKNYNNKYNKGFTLVELIIALGMFGAVISLIMSIFIVNLKSYIRINTDLELQYQAQHIINFMSSRILESSDIDKIINGTTIYTNPIEEIKVTKISFQNGLNKSEWFNFEVKNNNIYYGKGSYNSPVTVEVGNYIKEMRVGPIPRGNTIKESKAIIIKLLMIKESQEYEIEQIIAMRNY